MKCLLIYLLAINVAAVVVYIIIYADTVSRDRKQQQQNKEPNDHKL